MSFGAAGLLAQGALLGFTAAASPGPFQAYALAQGARHGRRAAVLALAPLASDAPIVAACLTLLTQAPQPLLRGLAVVGGAWLLTLGIHGLRARPPAPGTSAAAPAPARSFAAAAVMNAFSPGPWIFWTAVSGPILVGAWRASAVAAVAFLAGFYTVLVGANAAVVLAGAGVARLGDRSAALLPRLAALALLVCAGFQLRAGLFGS